MYKECNTCKTQKPLESFHKSSDGAHGVRGSCKECELKKSRKYYLKKLYGLSFEDYKQMLEDQDNRCAICGDYFDNSNRNKCCCVDHDHDTGVVRGLLCGDCNRALGLLKDSEEVLMNAINYLRRN